MSEKNRYRTYQDCDIDELEEIVAELEHMSIVALKQKKKDLRKTILKSVQEAKKTTVPTCVALCSWPLRKRERGIESSQSVFFLNAPRAFRSKRFNFFQRSPR